MDQNMAWQAIRTAFRCSAELQALLRTLKENCSAEEYREFARGIAATIDTVNRQVVDRALSARPELRERIESDLERFGKLT